jgi:hypothetical protein
MAKNLLTFGQTDALRELANKVRKEAGFEVYFYSAEPFRSGADIPEGVDRSFINHPLNRCASHNLRVDKNLRYDDLRFSEGCFYQLGGNPYPQRDNFGVVGEGSVFALKEKRFQVPGDFVEVSVPREGLLGKIGLKKTETRREQKTEHRSVSDGTYLLNDVVNTSSSSPANFVMTPILANFRDGSGRNNGKANLIVYCDYPLRKAITGFLQSNPEMYNSYQDALLPKEKFPDTCRRMTDKRTEPSSLIFWKNPEPRPMRGPSYQYIKIYPEDIEKYGRVVKVK